MGNPRVSIIILNWNSSEDTIECLESLLQINYPNFDIILVDNASEDDSIERIREYCIGDIKVESSFFEYDPSNKPIHLLEFTEKCDDVEFQSRGKNSNNKQIILIKNDENKGFPGGNNTGMKFSLKYFNPDYILLLNNDTIVAENFLNELVKNGESREDMGILGPKIYYYDKPDIIWSAGCKISWKLCRGIQLGCNELDNGQFNEQKEVGYISGSAFLIKTELINKIGLMDEKYFLYFEESDWTLRANLSGYKSLYIPTATVWHKVSRAGGGISNPLGLYYITRNRWIFMKKWSKKGNYVFFVIYQAFGALIFPIILTVYYTNHELFFIYYDGLIDGIK